MREDFEKLFNLIREMEDKYGSIVCDYGGECDFYLEDFLPENKQSVKAGNKWIFDYGEMKI